MNRTLPPRQHMMWQMISIVAIFDPQQLAGLRETLHALAVDVGTLCASICFLASLLLRVIPTPLRIQKRWYRNFYNVLRWLALNNGWKVRR